MVALPLEVESEEVSEEVEAALARLESREHSAPLAVPTPAPAQLASLIGSDEMEEVRKLGIAMVASGYFQETKHWAQAVVKIMAGRELGIPPVASMVGIYVVQGQITLGYRLIASLVKRSEKYDYRVRELTDQVARLEFFERGESIGFSTFTIEDAKRARLIRQGKYGPSAWEAHPRTMLFARAITNGVRWLCPDVVTTPIYAQGELEQDEEGREQSAES